VRSSETATTPTQFLGVRLTSEEIDRLDRLQRELGTTSRSDAVRALVRAADKLAEPRTELPVAIEAQLDELVDDGWAGNRGEALTLVLNLGLSEFAKVHSERLPAVHRRARDLGDRSRVRRSADRVGGDLLER
jgi:hypothetical protein